MTSRARFAAFVVIVTLTGSLLTPHSAQAQAGDVPEVTVSGSVVYPKDTHYPSWLSVSSDNPETLNAIMEVVGDDGTVYIEVLFWNFFSFTGHDSAGAVLPEGTYALRLSTTDDLGNRIATETVGSARVSWLITYQLDLTRKVTATSSQVARWAGRCSKVTKRGSRGWKKGVGLRSGVTCKQKAWRASGVVSVHSIQLPAGWKGGKFTVSAFSGAARDRRRSLAVQEYFGYDNSWRPWGVLRSAVRLHTRNSKTGDQFNKSDGRIYWRVATLGGHRYDVKYFVVSFWGSVRRYSPPSTARLDNRDQSSQEQKAPETVFAALSRAPAQHLLY